MFSLSILFPIQPRVVATQKLQAVQMVTSLSQLDSQILIDNIDLKNIDQTVGQARAVIDGVKGAYYPVIGLESSYLDDRKKPTNIFQPARIQNLRWQMTLSEQTPWGLNFSGGILNDRTKLHQSEPLNPTLPYPASFFLPTAFLKLELDLVQNLFGAKQSIEWKQAQLDRNIAVRTKLLVRHKILSSSKSIFLGIAILKSMKVFLRKIIRNLSSLKTDVQKKVRRRIAEPGDVFKLQLSIAHRKADDLALNRQVDSLSEQLIGTAIGSISTFQKYGIFSVGPHK